MKTRSKRYNSSAESNDVATAYELQDAIEGLSKQSKVKFAVGEVVKILDGPFLNLTGEIEEIDPQKGTLKVSVSIFGRFTPVELEFWQVEKADEE